MRRFRLKLTGSVALALAGASAWAAEVARPPAPPLVQLAPPHLPPCPTPALGCDRDAEGPERGGVQAGAAVYFLSPYFENNAAFVTTRGLGTTAVASSETDFSWDLSASPAVWVGYALDGGLGARARWFQFDQSSNQAFTSLSAAEGAGGTIRPAPGVAGLSAAERTQGTVRPAPGVAGRPGSTFGAPGVLGVDRGRDQLNFRSRLEINDIDLELTCLWPLLGGDLQVSGGGRYTRLTQGYTGLLSNEAIVFLGRAGPVLRREVQRLDYRHDFTGGGPTLAVQGAYPLGGTGLAVYGSARGSLLVGTSREATRFTGADPAFLFGIPGAADRPVESSDARSQTHVLPVAEVELGFQYATNVGRVRPFVRAAAVNRTYFNAGNASQDTGDLSLLGGQLTLGLGF